MPNSPTRNPPANRSDLTIEDMHRALRLPRGESLVKHMISTGYVDFDDACEAKARMRPMMDRILHAVFDTLCRH